MGIATRQVINATIGHAANFFITLSSRFSFSSVHLSWQETRCFATEAW
jgi:hypothetical protein